MRRIAAALLCLAWVAIMSTALAIRWLHSDPRLPGELPFAAVMLMFVTAGGVLVAARPRNPIGWLLCAIALFDAQNRLGFAVAAVLPQLLSGSHLAASAVALSYVLNQQVMFTLIPVILLLFPDGRLLSPRWRPVAIAPLVIGVTAALVTLLAAGPVRPNIGEIAKPFGLPELVPIAELLKGLAFLSFVLGLVLGAASLFRRYRSGGPVQRQQIKWMIASASLIALFFLTVLVMLVIRFFLPGAFEDHVVLPIVNVWNAVAALSLPVAIAIAILRYRLYDIDLLINRTLVYGAVTALLAATYFGAVVLIQSLLRPFTSGSELAVAASTLLVVALFQPLRRRVQGAVDRRFYRSRYDAARTLDAFGARLRDEVDLDSVRADLLDVVHDTLRPAHANVWLRSERAR